MARVPNAEKAVIDPEKLAGYILSQVHPVGRFKAAFFERFGYSANRPELFGQHLKALVLSNDASATERSAYGWKYVVEGRIEAPNGTRLQVVTVWVILDGQSVPRFVTAYPKE